MIPPPVRATVFDIHDPKNVPRAEDSFLVDTQVWLWLTLPHQGSPAPYQAKEYPDYVAAATKCGASLYRAAISLTELGRVLEDIAHKVAADTMNVGRDEKGRKALRLVAGHRQKIGEELRDAWSQVRGLSTDIGATDEDRLINLFESTHLDAGDANLISARPAAELPAVLTDDGDFVTVPDLKVFTANGRAISSAKRAGRLGIRGA